MIAEKIGSDSNQSSIASHAVRQGKKLIAMALQVDPIFAADLARLTGPAVWRETGGTVTQRLRAWYKAEDTNHRHCALAGMFASGSAEFADVIVPLLTSDDQQVRLEAYRVWPQFHLSTLGSDWQKRVSEWKEEARITFVGELSINEWRTDVAEYFAANDQSTNVKLEAIKFLSWIGAGDQVRRAIESLPQEVRSAALLQLHREEIPSMLHARALVAYREQFAGLTNGVKRIQNLLAQLALGADDTVAALKSELAGLRSEKTDWHADRILRTALTTVQEVDKQWVSEWVANRIISDPLWHDSCIELVTSIPETVKTELLHKLSNENLEHRDRELICESIGKPVRRDVMSRLSDPLKQL